MKYTYFEIRNFKGIESARLDLARSPRSSVHTLVGLNESGKTTVLEAINLLAYRESLEALELPGYGIGDPHDLIPIAKRANFNDKIVIKAGVDLSADDRRAIIAAVLKQHGVKITEIAQELEVTQSYSFKASRLEPSQPSIMWRLLLKGRLPGRRAAQLTGDPWFQATTIIKAMLPRVVYFPNFLFDFPDRIYLERAPSEEEKHALYRRVLQDVLDALGEGLNLQDHVLARAASSEVFAKKSLESVLMKMGSHITETVFSQWNRVLRRKAVKKEIVVDIARDGAGPWYLQLRLKDHNELYAISERSLGFRWFFTYLLLTQYRGFRRGEAKAVIFLLDEPASNLHPSAQTQLLDSFNALPGGCTVVYTTHSHHMIKPESLENAFVVKNAGLEYSDGDQEYTARRTLITLQRYREFAAHHPDQTTYFQPILDVLDYAPSRLELVPRLVMVEGKGDFYILRFAQRNMKLGDTPHLLPGGGAGSLDSPIALYIAWARDFLVLLDSDAEGERQRKRYCERFGPNLNDKIFLLADLDPKSATLGIEGMFLDEERLAIQRCVYPAEGSYQKKLFHRAVQELTLTGAAVDLSDETVSRFRAVLSGLDARLDAASGSSS